MAEVVSNMNFMKYMLRVLCVTEYSSLWATQTGVINNNNNKQLYYKFRTIVDILQIHWG